MTNRTSFMSLSRELRDQIYAKLLISPQPMHFNRISGPIVYDVEDNLLTLWSTLPQIAEEACKMFYQQNTFVVFDGDLPSFLGSSIHSWTIHACQDSVDRLANKEAPEFRVRAWVTKIEIFQEQSMFIDSRDLGAGLRQLLACPHLQSVVIDTGRGFWRMLDGESKLAIEELTKKIGGGFKVHMEGSGYRSGVEYLI